MFLRKILLIILFIVAVIALSIVLYFFFFAPAKPTVTPSEAPAEEFGKLPMSQEEFERLTAEERARLGLPEAGVVPSTEREETGVSMPEYSEIASGGKTWVEIVANDVVIGAALASDGQKSVYYNKTDGKFYEIDAEGNKIILSGQSFYNVEKINWAPTKDRVILEYPDGFKIMYDFRKQKQYTLPKNWSDFSWNSVGSRIAFKTTGGQVEQNWLAMANPDGTGLKPIAFMGENADKVIVNWSPNNQVVAFSRTGQSRGVWEQEILLIGQNQENFRSLIVEGRGFESQWSPSGEKIAYSVYSADSNYNPKLYVVNASGDKIGTGKIDTGLTTWSYKCTFAHNDVDLYCAVPRDLPQGVGLVPDLITRTQDDFYKINLQTGQTTFLAESVLGGYDVQKMFVSQDGSLLYFIDKNTNNLRYIRLK